MKTSAFPVLLFFRNYRQLLLPVVFLLLQGLVLGQETEVQKEQVVERFWQLLLKNPRNGTSFDRVYEWYADTGKLDELLARCARLTREQPQNGKYFLLSGMLAQRSHDDTNAQLCYDKAAQLDPQDTLALKYLGNLYLIAGQLNEAAETFEKAILRKPNEDEVQEIMITLGRIYERLGEFDKAKANWSRLEQMFPNLMDIKLQIAETLEEEGRHEEALTRFNQLIELAKNDDSNRVRFVLAAAEIKSRLGRRQEAVADFEQLLTGLTSDSYLAESVRDRIERLYINEADYAGLADYYKSILKSKPGQMETVRRLAVILVRLDRKKEARQLLTDSIAKAPSNVPLRLACIDLLVEAKEYGAATKLYAEINKIDVNNPDHLIQWGLTLLNDTAKEETLRRSEAQDVWTLLLSGHEKESSRYVMLANLLQENGMIGQAEPYYLKAVELSPNDPSYREYLGNYYHRQGNREKAVKALLPMVQGEHRNAESLVQLAGIFESYGYHDDSLPLLRDAASESPDDFDIQFQYANKLTDRVLGKRNDQTELVMPNEKTIAEVDHQMKVAEKCATTSPQYNSIVKLMIRFDTELNRLAAKTEQLQAKIKTGPATASDSWKLAMYYHALGQQEEAIRVLETGLAKENSSVLLLQLTAELYIQVGNDKKAVEILTRLAKLDSVGRVETLRKLALVQRNMGLGQEAKKTAQAVMVSGSGHPENIRFYADFLFSLGDTKEGLDILGRAARTNPSDDASLYALANAFENASRFNDAIDVFWRLFDRTTELENKISITSRLAELHQKTSQFEKLISRLRGDSRKPQQRRENAFCLAQAYISVQNYESARKALETLLPQTERDTTGDTLLLSQLATIAENQGDLDRAIHYQQLLCDITKKPEHLESLAMLLFQNGDKVQGQNVYLNVIASKKGSYDRIGFIDELLAHGEYELCGRLMERLDQETLDDWEILYRKAEMLYWQGKKKEAAEVFQKITSLPIDSATPSAAETKRLKNQAPFSQKRTVPNYNAWYTAWYLPLDNKSETATWKQREDFNIFTGLKTQVIPSTIIETLFRERLQLLNQGGVYSTSAFGAKLWKGSTGPAQPQFIPVSFGQARNIAYLWQLKILFDDDHDDQGKPLPPEKANWFKKLADFKSRFPMDSHDTDTLDTRLWLETVPRIFYCINQKNMSFADDLFGTSMQSVKRLAIKLGMLDHKAYRDYTITNILTDLSLPFVIKNFDELRNSGKLDKILDLFEFPGKSPEELKQFVLNEFNQYREQMKEESEHGPSVQKKIDWLYRTIVNANLHPDITKKSMNLYQLKLTKDVLRLYNSEKKLDQLLNQYKNDQETKQYLNAISRFSSFDISNAGQSNLLRLSLRSTDNKYVYEELTGTETEQRLREYNETLQTFGSEIEQFAQRQTVNKTKDLSLLQHQFDFFMIDRLAFWEIPFRNYMEISEDSSVIVNSISMNGMAVQLNDPWKKITRKSSQQKKIIDQSDLDYMKHVCDRMLALFRDYIKMGNRLALCEEQMIARSSSLQSRQSFFARNIRYLANSRSLSTYDIDSLLADSSIQSYNNTFIPSLFQICQRLDTFLENTPAKDSIPHNPFFIKEMKEEWERMKMSDPKLSRQFMENIDIKIAAVSQTTATTSMADIDRMTQILEKEYQAAKSAGRTLSQKRLVLLAILYAQGGKSNQAVQCLDEINLVMSSDIKAREVVILNLATANPEKLKPRLIKALDHLSGYNLTEDELVKTRKAYQLIHRDKAADEIFKRLLLVATTTMNQYNLLNDLDQKGDEMKEAGLVFALKIYRSYRAVNLSESDIRSHCRNRALNLIKRYGKLGEVTSQLESQLAQSAGSYDLQMELADTYFRSNRKEDAKKILLEMEKNQPADAQKMLNFATLCQKADMIDLANKWSIKAFEKKPELMFNNFWSVAQQYEKNNRLPDLIAIIRGMKKELLARHANNLGNQLYIWASDPKNQPLIKDLWNELCNLEPAPNINPIQVRRIICQHISLAKNPFFESVLKRHVFESLFPSDQNQLPNVLQHNSSIHQISSWTDSEIGMTSIALMNCATDLDAIQKELQKGVALLKNNTNVSTVSHLVDAAILDVMINLKNGKYKESLDAIDQLEKDKSVESNWNFVKPGFAFFLSSVNDRDCLLKAIELLKQSLTLETSRNYTNILFNRLSDLYIQLNMKEEGHKVLLAHLDKTLDYLERLGIQNSIVVGRVSIDRYSQILSLLQTFKSLAAFGFHMDIARYYYKGCQGHSWFNYNLQQNDYYAIRLKKQAEESTAKITFDDYLKYPEMLVSKFSDNISKQDKKDSPGNIAAIDHVMLATYVKESNQIGSHLFDLLTHDSKENSKRFAQLIDCITQTSSERPAFLAPVIALGWCDLLQYDDKNLATHLNRCAKLLENRKSFEHEDFQSIVCSSWLLVREIMTTPEWKNRENVQTSARLLLEKIIAAIQNETKKTKNNSQTQWLSSLAIDMGKVLTNQKDSEQINRLIPALCESMFYNNPQEFFLQFNHVSDEFESMAKNGWGLAILSMVSDALVRPRVMPNDNKPDPRGTTIDVLFLLNRVLVILKETNADSNRVYEQLKQIVFPKGEGRTPRFCDYEELGGRDGYFRSPAFDLVDWGIQSGHTDEIFAMIGKCRESVPEASNDDARRERNELLLRCDTLEFYLCLVTGKTDKARLFADTFTRTIREKKNTETAKFVLMALASAFDHADSAVDQKVGKPPVICGINLSELMTESVLLAVQGKYKRFAMYVIHRRYELLAEQGDGSIAIRLATFYRDRIRPKDSDEGGTDWCRFLMDEIVLNKGIAAAKQSNLSIAIDAIRYLNDVSKDSYRRCDLTELVRLVQPLWEKASPEVRKRIGVFEPDKITLLPTRANKDQAKDQVATNPEPAIASDCGLPKLPEGKNVYRSDFRKGIEPVWSIRHRETDPGNGRVFLGEFNREKVRLQLNSLPEHKFIRVRFDLIILTGADGLIYGSGRYGEDTWNLDMGHVRLIGTTFSNFRNDPYSQKQSWPDDYPPQFGIKHNWYEKVMDDDMWDETCQTGYYHGREGAVKDRSMKYDRYAVYPVDLVIPHDSNQLELCFHARFQEGAQEFSALTMSQDESWALDNVRVDVIDQPLKMTQEEIDLCWNSLIGSDGLKAAAARWRLLAAGEKALNDIHSKKQRAEQPDIKNNDHFPGFRIWRVERLWEESKNHDARK